MAEYGKQCRVACIGQSGEKLSLISCVMTDRGSAAGRSGLGAVMGSKKLKAVVARGTMPVPWPTKRRLKASAPTRSRRCKHHGLP